MELSDHVIELFHGNINACMQGIESLADPIASASELLVQCLLSDHKILCCGDGISALISQHFATNLLNRFQYERPSLPALSLTGDAATLSAIAADSSFSEVYAKQIRALGQEGDILLMCYIGSGSGTALRAIQAAHERGMQIITLSNENGGDAASLLTPEDIELFIPSDNRARVAEIQLLTIHCLCELIDHLIFGHEV